MGKVEVPHSLFNDHFALINQLDDFSSWDLVPGMRFGDKGKWWGNHGERTVSHEGIDLLSFRDNHDMSRNVTPGLWFPPLFEGAVVGIFEDFLGKSILFRHDYWCGNAWQLYSVFGHARPVKGLSPGIIVSADQPVVTVAESGKKASLSPHLHVSLMWISPGKEANALEWGSIVSSDEILLIDPMEILSHNES